MDNKHTNTDRQTLRHTYSHKH